MFNYDYLKKASAWEAVKTLSIIKGVKERKSVQRTHRNGFSNDKGKTMRHTARLPTWILGVPEYAKYFNPSMPFEDRRKEMDKFFKLEYVWAPWGEKINPQSFLTVDRL